MHKDRAPEVNEAQLIHRLLSFSDIVMGFSLALLGLSLHPSQAIPTLRSQGPELAVFLVGFGLIALVWWFHNKLFAHYFVANAISIVLNFAMLAGVVLLVYVVESFGLLFRSARFDGRSYVLGVSLWFCTYGLVMTLMGAMYGIGLRERWSVLSASLRLWGLERAANAGAGGIMLVAMGLSAPHLPLRLAWMLAAFAFFPLLAEKMAIRIFRP